MGMSACIFVEKKSENTVKLDLRKRHCGDVKWTEMAEKHAS
jgi:hypothetical protein